MILMMMIILILMMIITMKVVAIMKLIMWNYTDDVKEEKRAEC